MVKRPAVLLAFLSPLTAEFLLGDQYLAGPPSFAQLGMLIEFVAFYGCGALLVREVTRRSGRGWPTILALALAFGVFEEGLLTQSLFNPNYAGLRLLDYGFIPSLGIAGPWTVFVLTLHVVWSICTPIALTEALAGDRGPWLGTAGFGAVTGLFTVGAAGTFVFSFLWSKHFIATPAQLGSALLIITALVAIAFTAFGAPARTRAGSNWLGLILGFVAGSGFHLIRDLPPSSLPPWTMTVLLLTLEGLAVTAVLALRPGAFGLAAGAALTYCWIGMQVARSAGVSAVLEQSVLVALVIGLLLFTARAVTRNRPKTPLRG